MKKTVSIQRYDAETKAMITVGSMTIDMSIAPETNDWVIYPVIVRRDAFQNELVAATISLNKKYK